MPPKPPKPARDESQEQQDTEPADQELNMTDLHQEIHELRRKLASSQTENERNLQESVRERNFLIRQYQEQIRSLTNEKDDEIQTLTRANNLYRDMVQGTQVAKKSHEIPLPRQVLFDGKGTWESFAKPFEALVESCKWNQEECLFRLQSSLRGEAAEYAFNQTTQDTLGSYSKLLAALETRYKERRTASSYLAELENRKLQPKEKIAEYVSEIRKLVIKGYPTADEITRETINIRHFIKGLQDQQAALHIGMKDPTTIEEARTILETYNSLRDEAKMTARVREVKSSKTPSSEEYVTESRLRTFGQEIKTSLGKKIDHLANQIAVQSGRPRQNYNTQTGERRQNADIVCYHCGELGHYARRCNKRDDDKNAVKKQEN